MRKGIIAISLILAGLSIYLYQASFSIPSQSVSATGWVPGPAFVPKIILALLFATLIGVLGQTWWQQDPRPIFKNGNQIKRIITSVLVTGAYVGLIGRLGYWPATTLYFIVLIFILRGKSQPVGNVLSVLAFSLVFSLVVTITFRIFLGVPLPGPKVFGL
ncbi:MAG: tripartite tricarboxylate transporter TctB family protein [Firmicutes bacterium]|nr:tripartite tricarboxylate transporter TctB family protein [Bacillota bacterium]